MKKTSPNIQFARVLILAILGGLVVWHFLPDPPARIRGVGGVDIGVAGIPLGGAFELVDHTGKTVTDQDFLGRYMLIYFGYSFCPDVCPTSLYTMVQALNQTRESVAASIQPVFITVDPARDTPEHLSQYVTLFSGDLVGLSGTQEQVNAAAKAYRVYFRKADEKTATEYLMDHSSYYYLVGPDGKTVKIFGHEATAEDIAAVLNEIKPVDSSAVVTAEHGWARQTAPGQTAGAAYMRVINHGAAPVTLLLATTAVAREVQIHTHMQEDGVMRMRQLSQLDIAPGATVTFAPGGLHLMLMGLDQPLVQGQIFDLVLMFKGAKDVVLPVTVQAIGAKL